jgi:DMSO/TMAO reductase YedYZ molybdopterin-dependent catalytic subunit
VAGRGTNLALLALLAMALATGALSFALGSALVRVPAVAHGAVGLGLLLLVPWKSAIVRRGLRRRRPGSWASVAFAVSVAACLGAGVGHSTGLLRSVGGVTSMQVHVGAALASVPLCLWHVGARRVRPRRTDLSRRALLRAGLLAAGSLAAYGALAAVVRAALPGRGRRFTGSFEVGSFDPHRMPVVQWLDDPVPTVDPARWSLRVVVHGEERARLGLDALDALREPVRATLDCTGGWFAEQRWEGVRLASLLRPVVGRSLTVRSVTGYWRRYPLADAGRLWLATRVEGEPLSPGHGFPARVVAPGRRGFWWVKWVSEVEVSDVPWWWQPPFPLT